MWVQNQMNVLVEIGEINRGTWGTKSQYYIPWSFDDEAHGLGNKLPRHLNDGRKVYSYESNWRICRLWAFDNFDRIRCTHRHIRG